MQARPHVLIIGGGIAGSAAALFLHRAGVGSTVYEAHPRRATTVPAARACSASPSRLSTLIPLGAKSKAPPVAARRGCAS